jgi:hypothetical protein
MRQQIIGLAFSIGTFAMSAAAQTNTFPATGNVGIGTTTPSSALQIVGNITLSHPSGTNNSILMNATSAANLIYFETAGVAQWGIDGTNWNGGTNDFEIDRYSNSGAWLGAAMLLQRSSGNVGIGTATPGAKLEVDGNLKLTSGSGASITFQDGTTQSTAYAGATCGGDFAESVDVSGIRAKYEPGDVLIIDPNAPGKFSKSAEPYSTSVTGIYSTKPGTVGRRQTTPKSPDEVPMAMIGIVPTKVSAENGSVRPGDLLVTSSTVGYAMKGTDRNRLTGAVIGKALGSLDSGTGVVEVVVTLQ